VFVEIGIDHGVVIGGPEVEVEALDAGLRAILRSSLHPIPSWSFSRHANRHYFDSNRRQPDESLASSYRKPLGGPYNFYFNDRQWGRTFVRICPYLPFSARVYRDRARKSRLPASAVLFASRVLRQPIFHRAALDNLGERLLDANRTIGRPDKITVIFGRKINKHYRGKLQTEIEDMNLPNPVIRSHGNGFIIQYVRDHLILRTEAASNNVKDYKVNKAVENLPVLRETLSAINDNYLNVQQDILETFIDRGQLRKLAEPAVTAAGKRIPGLKLDHPR
jgi:hypothetical protein